MDVQHEIEDPVEPTEPKAPTRGGRLVGRMRRDEEGFVLVWTALFLMVLLGFAALAVDLGHSYYVGQQAQNAADAAALAGAPYLPSDLAGAQAAAAQVAASNGFAPGSDVTIDAEQDPGNPAELDVTIHQHVPTFFGGAIGFNATDVTKTATGIANQAATTKPTDMVLILDRTGSMKPADLQSVQDASNALLAALDPTVDRLALAFTGQSDTTQTCGAGALGKPTKSVPPNSATWIVAPYPSAAPLTNYQDPANPIAQSIACITTGGFNSSVGTDLGNPVQAALNYLTGLGDDGAQKDIILMTDGAANVSPNGQPCAFANNTATAAKNAGITVVTIGFGVGDKSIADDTCTDSSGAYDGAPATTLLADMSSPVNGTPANDKAGCVSDGNFFCEPKNGDLSGAFVQAAQQLTAGQPRLVH